MILHACVVPFLILLIRLICNSDIRWIVIAMMRIIDENCDSDCPPKKKRSNESRSSSSTTAVNKRKFAGAAKSKTKFMSIWTKKWPCIVGVTGCGHEVKRTDCCKIVSCSYQGESDVSCHLEGARHKEKVKSALSSKGLFSCGFRAENHPIPSFIVF